MWPFVGNYTKQLLQTTVEPQVQNSLPKSLTPFKFEKIDLGDIVKYHINLMWCNFDGIYYIMGKTQWRII